MASKIKMKDGGKKYYFNRIHFIDNNKVKEFKYIFVKMGEIVECIFMNFQTDKGKKYFTQVYTTSQDVHPPKGTRSMDVFCVSGGQGGSAGDNKFNRYREISSDGGCGGNGGSTNTTRRILLTEKDIMQIRIGGGGGGSWTPNETVAAGRGGESAIYIKGEKVASSNNDFIYKGSAGGFGGWRSHWSGVIIYTGSGGSNGGNSYREVSPHYSGYSYTNYGQGSTTKAFGEDDQTLFSGGGGGGMGGAGYVGGMGRGWGGAGGGGNGGECVYSTSFPTGYGGAGGANTGGGGGGGAGYYYDTNPSGGTYNGPGGNGGSGIVICRFYGSTKR